MSNQFKYMQSENGEVFQTINPEYHLAATLLSQAKGKAMHIQQTKEKVKAILEGIDTIYGIVRHVSASGMSRDIDLYIIKDNQLQYLTVYASVILGYTMSKNRGMKVGGCGMDMVFSCVSSLAKSVGIDYKSIRSEII